MTRIALVALSLVVLTASAEKKPLIIDSAAEVSKHIGKVVTLRGTVERSKQATLLGVDVDADEGDMRGKEGEATGRLEKYILEDPPSDERFAVATRGGGTYYRLVDLKTGRTAKVNPVTKAR